MTERLPEHLDGPDGTVEGMACFLMTFLDPSQPSDCYDTIKLMQALIPLYCESYTSRKRGASG